MFTGSFYLLICTTTTIYVYILKASVYFVAKVARGRLIKKYVSAKYM